MGAQLNLESDDSSYERAGSASWWGTLAGVLPFLVIGLVLSLLYLNVRFPFQGGTQIRTGFFIMLWTIVPIIGIGVGWAKRFPRWSFAYLGPVVAFLWYFDISRIADRGGIVALFFWIPLTLTLLVAFLWTRSLRPLGRFLKGIWGDSLRLSFGLYSMLPLLITIRLDEIKSPTDLILHIVTMTILSLGALFYMRSSAKTSQALSLLLGATLCWTVLTVGNGLYWHGRLEPWMGEPANGIELARNMTIGGGLMLALLFAPLLLNLFRLSVNRLSSA